MYLILDFVHKLLSETVQPSDVCVDATCGNGNDTIHLAGLVVLVVKSMPLTSKKKQSIILKHYAKSLKHYIY